MFDIVIGLEVHVQLNTKTKIFCSCATSFNEKQNSNTCPTCLGLPGALPVLNGEAVRKAMMFGHAVEAKINEKSIFNRKNYFYPDSPKAYQISQFDVAIVEGGHLMLDYEDGSQKKIGITRAHLEEDAGKNIHESSYSKVDLNRCGTPLLEIVSEPDMNSAEDAVLYLKKLHSIVRYLDISDANMQEGSFRCDVNISIKPKTQQTYGTRVEIKNMNSFKFIQQAIHYEVQRQIEAYEDGVYEEEVVQETRLFDADTGETRSMRGKEESADYRYFPDPDLRPLIVTPQQIEDASNIPELPDAKKQRYVDSLGLRAYDAAVICADKETAKYFDGVLECGVSAKNAVNYLINELSGHLNKEGLSITQSPISAQKLGSVIKNLEDETINGKGAKKLLEYLMTNDVDVAEAIEKLNLKQVSDDGAILSIIQEVLTSNEDKVAEYKGGKEKLFGFFVGQVMKKSQGSANPAKVNELLKQKLG